MTQQTACNKHHQTMDLGSESRDCTENSESDSETDARRTLFDIVLKDLRAQLLTTLMLSASCSARCWSRQPTYKRTKAQNKVTMVTTFVTVRWSMEWSQSDGVVTSMLRDGESRACWVRSCEQSLCAPTSRQPPLVAQEKFGRTATGDGRAAMGRGRRTTGSAFSSRTSGFASP